mmetsp:Transcript_1922/g.5720  ORF Transcript_1922/g.5720 Transcript_1922/m.5720 type:complete len:230 (-) Transcript_1922:431-1120(-)
MEFSTSYRARTTRLAHSVSKKSAPSRKVATAGPAAEISVLFLFKEEKRIKRSRCSKESDPSTTDDSALCSSSWASREMARKATLATPLLSNSRSAARPTPHPMRFIQCGILASLALATQTNTASSAFFGKPSRAVAAAACSRKPAYGSKRRARDARCDATISNAATKRRALPSALLSGLGLRLNCSDTSNAAASSSSNSCSRSRLAKVSSSWMRRRRCSSVSCSSSNSS